MAKAEQQPDDADYDDRLLYNKRMTARLVGISVQALDHWDAQPVEHRGREALYYWPNVRDEFLRRRSDPLRGEINELRAELAELDAGDGPSEGDLDLDAERARLAAEQADKIAMENAEKRGELMHRDHVLTMMGKSLTAFRARVLAAAAKLAPRANPGNPNLAREHIDRELSAALAELANFDPGEELGDDARDGANDPLDPPAAAEADRKPVGRRKPRPQ